MRSYQNFIFTIRGIIILFLIINVHSAYGGINGQDKCDHVVGQSSSFFNGGFIRKFFKHWVFLTRDSRPQMKFFLYKRAFPECGRALETDNDELLKASGYNADHPTRIIIHGWMSQSEGSFNRAVKNAYLSLTMPAMTPAAETPPVSYEMYIYPNDGARNGSLDFDEYYIVPQAHKRSLLHNYNDFNIILVDWSDISLNVHYIGVVKLIAKLGLQLAEFMRFLQVNAGLQFNDVYLIGHSLGAHIAGSAGNQIQPFLVNTIFALDPAGPQFRDLSSENRLDSRDAFYVESIQTSSTLGLKTHTGHATFYPNFGENQKKCYFFGCSHSRAHNYFAESITSTKGFWGTPCKREADEKWVLTNPELLFRMGGEPSTPKYGTFYVQTNGEAPFAMGRRILSANNEYL